MLFRQYLTGSKTKNPAEFVSHLPFLYIYIYIYIFLEQCTKRTLKVRCWSLHYILVCTENPFHKGNAQSCGTFFNKKNAFTIRLRSISFHQSSFRRVVSDLGHGCETFPLPKGFYLSRLFMFLAVGECFYLLKRPKTLQLKWLFGTESTHYVSSKEQSQTCSSK